MTNESATSANVIHIPGLTPAQDRFFNRVIEAFGHDEFSVEVGTFDIGVMRMESLYTRLDTKGVQWATWKAIMPLFTQNERTEQDVKRRVTWYQYDCVVDRIQDAMYARWEAEDARH